jgi:hypothetical protein
MYDISISEYEGFIRDIIKKFNVPMQSEDYENAFDVGRNAYIKANNAYDANKGTSFSTFFYNTVYLYVKQYLYNRKRNSLTSKISLDQSRYETDQDVIITNDIFYSSSLVVNNNNNTYEMSCDLLNAYEKVEKFIDDLRDKKKPKSCTNNLKYDVLVEIYDRVYKNEERLSDLAKEKGIKIQIIHKRDKRLKQLIKENVDVDLSFLK